MLDTHTLLWWFTDSVELSARARALILDEANEMWVSVASAWEISTKSRIGKLPHVPDVVRDYASLVSRNGFRALDITPTQALHAGSIAHAHKDPFDRMIATQSILEKTPVITRDPQIAALGASTVW
ncbi:MAG: type II toxin-antitoxin system VapC family toxin [Microbacterium sp.]